MTTPRKHSQQWHRELALALHLMRIGVHNHRNNLSTLHREVRLALDVCQKVEGALATLQTVVCDPIDDPVLRILRP